MPEGTQPIHGDDSHRKIFIVKSVDFALKMGSTSILLQDRTF
jgi:hypothetical protein